MARSNYQELGEVSRRIRPSPDGQKIDDLNEQARSTTTRLTHHPHQISQPRQEPIVPNPQQRPTRYIPNPRCLNNNRPRPPPRKTLVPIEHILRNDSILARPPW